VINWMCIALTCQNTESPSVEKIKDYGKIDRSLWHTTDEGSDGYHDFDHFDVRCWDETLK
jgi:hypothetical protein